MLRAHGLGFRVWGKACKGSTLGFRVWGLGWFRVRVPFKGSFWV